jgi:hypothetical protein
MVFYCHDSKIEMKIMKTKAVAVIAGALVTLILWAIAFVILNGVYHGDFPWLLSMLIALLCPLIGGYAAAGLEPTNGTRLGALSGFGAGLVVILAIAIASSWAPNATLLGILMVLVGTFGGGAGAHLTRRGQKVA